ncbi:hypothetical protein ABBQ38_014382 [Trebouxia sp. C0009 RCD-2024]
MKFTKEQMHRPKQQLATQLHGEKPSGQQSRGGTGGAPPAQPQNPAPPHNPEPTPFLQAASLRAKELLYSNRNLHAMSPGDRPRRNHSYLSLIVIIHSYDDSTHHSHSPSLRLVQGQTPIESSYTL